MPTDTERYKQFEGKRFETSVGRLLFNAVLPRDYPFINQEVGRKRMSELIDDLLERYGVEKVPPIIDRIKTFGFRYATYSGITWGLGDVKIPQGKETVIERGHKAVAEVVEQYKEGLLSEARGSFGNLNQMAGMKGIIQNVSGVALEFPILSCYKEGLTPLEYFITTHGSRKGLTDTALNTAKAGYLTRRLFDVAQDEIVTEEDCGTKDGTLIHKKTASGIETLLSKNIKGRFLASDLL
ncbi:MAG: DNA-directed RNA polymerase subunit beta', partial [Candidatus Nomurabacteria bacterium GW2011_GWA2_40_9]